MIELELPWPPKELSPNAKWSAEEDEALRQMVLAGMSHTEISAISGRSAGAVKNRCWRLGMLVSREWTEDQLDTIRKSFDGGNFVDLDDLCRRLGKTKHAVHVKVSRLGLGDISRPRVSERKVRTAKFSSQEERSAHISAIQKQLIKERGHPRHMKGKRHTAEAKDRIAEASRRMNAARTDEQKVEYLIKAMKAKQKNGTYVQERTGTTWKAGWRDIGGARKYYRSKWEANYAYYLEWLKIGGHISEWQHEAKTFWFEGVKRGCVSYLPDFRVVEVDGSEAFHEVKGWMDARSKTKIKRMAKYYPDVKLIVIDSKAYGQLKRKVSGLVPGWEE